MQKNRIIINDQILKELFDLHVDSLCQFLSYYTRDQQEIEDVVQEVFIKIWEDRDSVNIFHIKTYLYTAARNQMLSRLRNQQNRLKLLENWANDKIADSRMEECYNMEEFDKVYHNAINTLPPKCKDIYVLSKEDGMTYKEISELKDISVKTVENQMSIAIKKMQEFILQYYSQTTGITLLIGTYIADNLS